MPNYIKPTFTLTANKNSNTNSPGPLSVALSLNASDTLSVDTVTSEIVTVAYSSASDNAVLLVDGSSYGPTLTGGTNGGYIWMKNTTSSGSNLIYIGVHPPGLEDIDATADDAARAHRFMTLGVGEFAWFPFDYTQYISVIANAANQQLEYWIFDRG